jgi:hypothetical protein
MFGIVGFHIFCFLFFLLQNTIKIGINFLYHITTLTYSCILLQTTNNDYLNLHYEWKDQTLMVNNSTNINKANNDLSVTVYMLNLILILAKIFFSIKITID